MERKTLINLLTSQNSDWAIRSFPITSYCPCGDHGNGTYIAILCNFTHHEVVLLTTAEYKEIFPTITKITNIKIEDSTERGFKIEPISEKQ